MKTTDEQIDSVALMMAAAYWRGRIEALAPGYKGTAIVEAIIERYAQEDKEKWKAAARVAVV